MEVRSNLSQISTVRLKEIYEEYSRRWSGRITSSQIFELACRQVLTEQAEISFKAGKEEAQKECYTIEDYDREVACYRKGKEAGVRTVVEAFDYDICKMAEKFPTAKELTDFINKWRCQLKEWER